MTVGDALVEARRGGVSDKVSRLILSTWSDLEPRVAGPLLAPIMVNEIAPRLQEEGTDIQDIEVYHFGFTQLLADCARALHAKTLEARHVKKVIDDCWHRYVGYDLIQYAIETKLLEEIEGDALRDAVRQAMADAPRAVEELKRGKDKVIGAIVGAVLKTHKANPSVVRELILGEIARAFSAGEGVTHVRL